MTQDEKEQLEVLLRKQLGDQAEIARNNQACPDPDWISAYIEGNLSQTLKSVLESHVSECRRCQEEIAFLLRTFPGEPKKPTPEVQQSGNKMFDWLSLSWMNPVFLKPVFSILVVAIVSGVLGYEIIFKQKPAVDKATQIAHAIAGSAEAPAQNQKKIEDRELGTVTNSRPGLDLRQARDKAASVAEKPQSNQSPPPANEERRFSPIHEPQSSLSKQNSRGGGLEKLEEETGQSGEKENDRKDLNEGLTTRPQVAGAPPIPSTAAPQPLNQVMVEKDSAMKNRESIEDKKVAEQTTPMKEPASQPPAEGSTGKRAMAVKGKAAPKDEGMYAAKAGESKSSVGVAGAIENKPAVQPHQIRLDGKTFELRQNVWFDLAIGKDSQYVPIVIRKGSPEYVNLVKELSLYQDVLNRPEDCLIKLNDHIYRVQKK